MITGLQPDDFLTVTPIGAAEFVIKASFVKELNMAWEGKPAFIFIRDPLSPLETVVNSANPKSKEAAIPISDDEYVRLKFKLTGDGQAPSKADYEKIVGEMAGTLKPSIKPMKIQSPVTEEVIEPDVISEPTPGAPRAPRAPRKPRGPNKS